MNFHLDVSAPGSNVAHLCCDGFYRGVPDIYARGLRSVKTQQSLDVRTGSGAAAVGDVTRRCLWLSFSFLAFHISFVRSIPSSDDKNPTNMELEPSEGVS